MHTFPQGALIVRLDPCKENQYLSRIYYKGRPTSTLHYTDEGHEPLKQCGLQMGVSGLAIILASVTYEQNLCHQFIPPGRCRTAGAQTLNALSRHCIVVMSLGNLDDYLLAKATEEGTLFAEHCLCAAEILRVGSRYNVTARFNNQAYHVVAVALALADNTLFRLVAVANASISVTNYPQPRNTTETARDQLLE